MNIKKLSREDFTQYGSVLSIPNDNEIKTDELRYWKGISTCYMGSMTTGLLQVNPRDPVVTELERHQNTTEVVAVLQGSGVMLFAEPGDNPERSMAGFRVKSGDSFSMLPGTWHSLILPDNDEDVQLLILFKEGTEDSDLDFRSLSEPLKIRE